jgi:isochorismate synthase EntC
LLGDVKSSLGDAECSLRDAKSAVRDATRSQDFHMLHFVLPAVEVREVDDVTFVAATVAWDSASPASSGELEVEVAAGFDEAVVATRGCVEAVWAAHCDGVQPRPFAPTELHEQVVHTPEWHGWERMVNHMLDRMAEDSGVGPAADSLQKVVLARRSECLLRCGGMDQELATAGAPHPQPPWQVDPLSLLSALQASNPTAYHFCLQVCRHRACCVPFRRDLSAACAGTAL